jgi:hypothetical protein
LNEGVLNINIYKRQNLDLKNSFIVGTRPREKATCELYREKSEKPLTGLTEKSFVPPKVGTEIKRL